MPEASIPADPLAERRRRHPPLLEAVVADARLTLAYRAEGVRFRSRSHAAWHVVRLAWDSDAFAAQILYRCKAWLQARGVPLLPRVAHRLSMAVAQVCIGDPVVVEPGIYVPHGQIVVDGISEVGAGTVFFPWVTVGLRSGDFEGPRIGRRVKVGTGAKIIGPISVGDDATIGANAVVVADVPAGTTVVGIPARPT